MRLFWHFPIPEQKVLFSNCFSCRNYFFEWWEFFSRLDYLCFHQRKWTWDLGGLGTLFYFIFFILKREIRMLEKDLMESVVKEFLCGQQQKTKLNDEIFLWIGKFLIPVTFFEFPYRKVIIIIADMQTLCNSIKFTIPWIAVPWPQKL